MAIQQYINQENLMLKPSPNRLPPRCPLLHRTAGDTERRYHLRYYKTGMCVHDTDNRGYCVKNGPHCAFAHGANDLRPPVYDSREQREMQEPGAEDRFGPNSLDKERSLLNDDPKWLDTTYVLANYKTEPCKKPPRLCRYLVIKIKAVITTVTVVTTVTVITTVTAITTVTVIHESL